MEDDFQSLQTQLQAALIATTRTAGQISAEDLSFQRSLNPDIGVALDEQSGRLLALSKFLLQSSASIAESRVPVIEDVDDVENNWSSIVDILDSLLEKADICLDEYTGLIKINTPAATEQPSTKPKSSSANNSFRARNLLKPQLAFKRRPDNQTISPWEPLLRSKPHAVVPLEQSLTTSTDELGLSVYQHPYEREITHLTYPKSVSNKSEPIKYQPFETTTATFVDTYEQVLEMLEELKQATEIAIDLEHHDARTYTGIVCLMQISTRDKDWIVDTLKPWREDLQVLNEVFANPQIVKVFHGAFMDIIWLQRDLGLYVVGLFDTGHAARALAYPSASLAYLLKKFINFDADKKYQLADWRIRPLPQEMFFYARADTHFLLYIYDSIRNELIDKSSSDDPNDHDKNLLARVLERSKETSLLLYKRQIYNANTGKGPGGWYQVLNKATVLFSPEQFSVYRAVHEWRDQIARMDDDSTNYVMPNHILLSLARLMPEDMVALLRTLHPISQSVKSRTSELLALIKSAKAKGIDGPSMSDIFHPEKHTSRIEPSSRPGGPTSSVPVAGLTPANSDHLQSDTSTFWGTAFGSSVWDQSVRLRNKEDSGVRLAVPLPPLKSEVFATKHQPAEQPAQIATEAPASESQHQPDPEKLADEPFSLNRGRKRKQEIIQNEVTAEQAEDENAEDEEEKAARKAARRAAKKEKSRRKREPEGATAEDKGSTAVEEEPFDYSNAHSVLNSKGVPSKQKASKQKPFDPYTQGSEATAKGIRRLQTEKAGRSHTFKK